MKNKQLNAAIIGFGNWGYRMYQAVATLPQVNIVALCNRSPITVADDAVQQIAHFSSYEEMLQHDALHLDFVILTTPHMEHPKIIELAAAKGIHVLKEKPFAINKAEADRYLELRNKYGVVINSLPQRMFADKIEFIKTAMKFNKDAATPLVIDIEYNLSIKTPFDGWRGSMATSGGGCVMDQGYHMIHLLILLFGKPEKVKATTGFIYEPQVEHVDPTEHTAHIEFIYKSGSYGVISLSRCHASKTEKFNVISPTRTVETHDNYAKLINEVGEVVVEKNFEQLSVDLLKKQVDYFTRIITKEVDDVCELNCNIATVDFIEAVYASAKDGETKCLREQEEMKECLGKYTEAVLQSKHGEVLDMGLLHP